MNEKNAVGTRPNISQIANELCELYQMQIDTLQQGTLAGLAQAELKLYRERQEQIRELKKVLMN
jgi:hypothetical protein